jgi:multicomponent Na+:H+ antiporter subunit D
MGAIVVGGLSLIGVPPTVGFISKWYLVLAVMERGWWPVALVVLVGSILALIYVWRLVEAAYFQRPAEGAAVPREAPLSMLAPIWLLVGANLYFGLATDLSVGSAREIASLLMGGGG